MQENKWATEGAVAERATWGGGERYRDWMGGQRVGGHMHEIGRARGEQEKNRGEGEREGKWGQRVISALIPRCKEIPMSAQNVR